MNRLGTVRFLIGCWLVLQCVPLLRAAQEKQLFDVSTHVQYEDLRKDDTRSPHGKPLDANFRTVIWLEPQGERSDLRPKISAGTYTMVQQNKEFVPHFLVVPVGSVVTFPNKDPFFHNVFSLFNGKRFDLGLYQSGQARAVTFNRVGVSYIFCNIHPEMAAVIITVDTPYYAVPNAHGDLVLQNVKEGPYRLHVWSENTPPDKLKSIERDIVVGPGHTKLEDITIPVAKSSLENHMNKFGIPYDAHDSHY